MYKELNKNNNLVNQVYKKLVIIKLIIIKV